MNDWEKKDFDGSVICKYCTNGGEFFIDEEYDMNARIVRSELGGYRIGLCMPHINCSHEENKFIETMAIKYCPFCGKRLEDDHPIIEVGFLGTDKVIKPGEINEQ